MRLTECGVSGCAHGFTKTKRGVNNCTRVEIYLTVLFDSRRWHMASGTCHEGHEVDLSDVQISEATRVFITLFISWCSRGVFHLVFSETQGRANLPLCSWYA